MLNKIMLIISLLIGTTFNIIRFDYPLMPLIYLVVFLILLIFSKSKGIYFGIAYLCVNLGVFVINYFVATKDLYFASEIYMIFYSILAEILLLLNIGCDFFEDFAKRRELIN